ncbi:MAG: hypothetical protein EGP89_01800 [Ruminococcaceae bacterium]|nr:hypothetical protein [Oscillospiraceae bacterium]
MLDRGLKLMMRLERTTADSQSAVTYTNRKQRLLKHEQPVCRFFLDIIIFSGEKQANSELLRICYQQAHQAVQLLTTLPF